MIRPDMVPTRSMWILTALFWPSDIWFSRQVFLVMLRLVTISADCLIWKHMSKRHYVLNIQQYSYLSRLDCGKASKPSGNMVTYKPYQTSAFIMAVFDHYKASHPCDDVALQSDCGHESKKEWSGFSSSRGGQLSNQSDDSSPWNCDESSVS